MARLQGDLRLEVSTGVHQAGLCPAPYRSGQTVLRTVRRALSTASRFIMDRGILMEDGNSLQYWF